MWAILYLAYSIFVAIFVVISVIVLSVNLLSLAVKWRRIYTFTISLAGIWVIWTVVNFWH